MSHNRNHCTVLSKNVNRQERAPTSFGIFSFFLQDLGPGKECPISLVGPHLCHLAREGRALGFNIPMCVSNGGITQEETAIMKRSWTRCWPAIKQKLSATYKYGNETFNYLKCPRNASRGWFSVKYLED